MKYIKTFNNHAEYEVFTATTEFILPNVSHCENENDVHYNPLACEESSTYELVGAPSYPSGVDGASASFDMTFNYKRTDINEKCKETITEGSDTVTVEIGTNPSTASSRTVEGVYDYHGLEIPYSVTQTKFEAKVTAKYNVTSTTSPTAISYKSSRYSGADGTSGFSSIEIDGVKQPSVTTGYTFSTVGEHVVKYTLKDQTSIGDDAFCLCKNLTSIVIPNSVTSIGKEAFNGCSGLTRFNSDTDGLFNIPSGVTTIDYSSFYNCSSLTSITIPDSVTIISRNVFSGCHSLTSIVIPNGITSISNSLFSDCRSLTSIGPVGSGASVEIPDSVTSIGSAAFFYCISLTSVTIGSGVTSISGQAFKSCNSLSSIDIPDSVTTIGDSAFTSCKSLTTCTIGSGVTSIGENAFEGCSGLTSIVIPDSVTSVSSGMCSGCTSLTHVKIGSGVTSIGNSAFTNCYSITSIDIPDGVTSIRDYAFYMCSGLTTCTIGSGVTSIGGGAFYRCSSLTSIVIPDSVTSIGNMAFNNCSGLTSITSNAMIAPTITNSTFYKVKTNGTLTVPSGSSGYDTWIQNAEYYLGLYNWTKVEQ